VGTISSVKVALEAEGDIKTRKRRSVETKAKRLFDGWTLENVSVNVKYIYKQQPPLGAKIGSDICPQTLSVPRSKQFSESVA